MRASRRRSRVFAGILVSALTAGGARAQSPFLVKDIWPGSPSSFPQHLVGIGGGRIVFFAHDATHGLEPWVSDGTTAGALLLGDLAPATGAVLPRTRRWRADTPSW